jgi:hypothetical protein
MVATQPPATKCSKRVGKNFNRRAESLESNGGRNGR